MISRVRLSKLLTSRETRDAYRIHCDVFCPWPLGIVCSCDQGPSALDPRSGSICFGGLSISSIYRGLIVAFSRPWIVDDISTMFELRVTFVFISCRPQ